MLTDISGDVRLLVVVALARKLDEVERVLQRCVVFYEDDQLTEARGRAVPRGEVYLSPSAVQDLSVIGEEIMHLHRWTRGFPAIEPLVAPLGLDKSLNQLSGHFDEATFFPFLEGLGLDPRAPNALVMEPNRLAIEAQIPVLQRNDPADLVDIVVMRKRFTVTYVQAALLAPATAQRDALLQVFQQPVLADVLLVGQGICAEIDTAIPLDPAGVEQSMNRCLVSLGVTAQAARMRTFAYPMA